MVDLTTLSSVKAYLGVNGPADDSLLQSMVTTYSEWVRTYCQINFDVRTYNIWKSGRGQSGISLAQRPLISVNSVSIDGVPVLLQTVFGGFGYRFTDRRVIFDGGAFAGFGDRNIQINYTAGYVTIPADIAQAVNELVGLRYKEKDRIGYASKTLAGELVSFIVKDMPVSVKTILDKYRLKVPL